MALFETTGDDDYLSWAETWTRLKTCGAPVTDSEVLKEQLAGS